MTKNKKKLIVDICNFVNYLLCSIIGLIIQANFHAGHRSSQQGVVLVLGEGRAFWHSAHVVFAILFTLGLIYHLVLNWNAIKALFKTNWSKLNAMLKTSKVLTILMFLTAIIGFVSYCFYLSGELAARMPLLEIHDKLGLIVLIIFIFHFFQHFKWLKKMISSHS